MALSNYELPDSTLQLIASSDFGDAFKPFNQNVTPGQSAGALKPDNLIKALRAATKAGPGNPGVNLLANRANGKDLKTKAYKDQIFHPQILRMKPGVKSDVVLPKAETQVPVVRPVVPPVIPPVVLPPDVPPVVPPVVPSPDEDFPPTIPPVVPSPDEDFPPTIPVVPSPDEDFPPTPDPVMPSPDEDFPPTPDPVMPSPDEDFPPTPEPVMPSPDLDFPPTPDPVMPSPDEDFPPTPLKDVSFWDDSNTPDPVGPNRGGGGDLDESFDPYLIDLINLSSGGGTGGGGKYFDDQSMATMAMAKGGKVTRDKLMGPDPAGPDDGFATLKSGEFVLNEKTAKEIGYEVLKRLNDRNK